MGQGFAGGLASGLSPFLQTMVAGKQQERARAAEMKQRLQQQQMQQDLARQQEAQKFAGIGELLGQLPGYEGVVQPDMTPEQIGRAQSMGLFDQALQAQRGQAEAEEAQRRAMLVYGASPGLQEVYSPEEAQLLGAEKLLGLKGERIKRAQTAKEKQAEKAEQRKFQKELAQFREGLVRGRPQQAGKESQVKWQLRTDPFSGQPLYRYNPITGETVRVAPMGGTQATPTTQQPAKGALQQDNAKAKWMTRFNQWNKPINYAST